MGPRKVLVGEGAWRPSCALQPGWPAQRPLPPAWYQLVAAQLNLPLAAHTRTTTSTRHTRHHTAPHPLHIALLAVAPSTCTDTNDSRMSVDLGLLTHRLARISHLFLSKDLMNKQRHSWVAIPRQPIVSWSGTEKEAKTKVGK